MTHQSEGNHRSQRHQHWNLPKPQPNFSTTAYTTIKLRISEYNSQGTNLVMLMQGIFITQYERKIPN